MTEIQTLHSILGVPRWTLGVFFFLILAKIDKWITQTRTGIFRQAIREWPL